MSIENLPVVHSVRPPWNKGRIVGQKRPLLPKHVWSIRVRLEMADNKRDLALFNMAIDCKLRGCDPVRLKVNDFYAANRVRDRASVTKSKTGKPVRFEITETTRLSVERWIHNPEMIGCEFLWPSRVVSEDVVDFVTRIDGGVWSVSTNRPRRSGQRLNVSVTLVPQASPK